MESMVWLRVPGDIVFAIGGVLLAIYAIKLLGRGKTKPVIATTGTAVQS
jgi:nitric oxide reductase subunit B